jgi:hypothetical protein
MSEIITVKPTSHSLASGDIETPQYAYDNSISTYALLHQTTSGTATSTTTTYSAIATVYYIFDFSNIIIPSGAVIIGADIHHKAYRVSSGTNMASLVTSYTIGAFNKTTSIKTTSITTTNEWRTTELTAEQAETWFNSTSPRVRCYARSNGRVKKATSYSIVSNMYIYEIYAELKYELSGITFKTRIDDAWVDSVVHTKINGEWIKPKEAFVKVDGVWKSIK